MKSARQNYHLHYRQATSLLAMDFILNNTQYLDIDYIFLFTPRPQCFSGYLTKKGLAQMRELGVKKILNNKNWKLEFVQAKKIFPSIDALPNMTVPAIGSEQFSHFCQLIKKYSQILVNTYIYCEQPALVALEEQVNNKYIHKKLEWIGHHKLAAHKRLSVLENIFNAIILKYSQKYHLSVHDIKAMTYDEFNSFIINHRRNIKPTVTKRKDGFVWRRKGSLWILETGDNYKKWVKKLLPAKKEKVVAGISTYLAKKVITGVAKLHLSFSKSTDIAKGTVLITGMTNPQLIPALKNAAAIITDEGGLMCHAAIISRELKIPCIVGTQDATQIFKNGDLIRVDTQAGTATKLS